MRQMEGEYLITFPKTHSMIKGEMLLKEADILARTMPLPPVLGDSCGFCIRLKEEELDKALSVFEKEDVEIGDVYRIDGEKNNRVYSKIYGERRDRKRKSL